MPAATAEAKVSLRMKIMVMVKSRGAPKVAVKKSAAPGAPALELEAMAGEQRIGRRQVAGWEARDEAEEAVEQREDHARAPTGGAGGWFAEIGEEPVRAGLRRGGESHDHERELPARKAIEHEVRDDEIERDPRRLPRGDVRADELDAAFVAPRDPRAGEPEHFRARVHARHARRRVRVEQRGEKTPVAFADDEHPARRLDPAHECRAAALEQRASADRLDPAIVWRDPVEGHPRLLRRRAGALEVAAEGEVQVHAFAQAGGADLG